MAGYAVIASTEDGVNSIEAGERCAARTWIALVARLGNIVEIITARFLQQIATGGGLVPQLCARTCQQSST